MDSSEHLLADRKSFAILVRQHHRQLLVYARALCEDGEAARDLVQDAFVAAYRKLDAFDLSKDFGAWMRGIVRFKWRDWMRSNHRRTAAGKKCAEAMESTMAPWNGFQRESERGSLFEALDDCIARLPGKLRDAVRRFYIDEKTGEQVADDLGASTVSVRKRLQRARQQLKECINRKLEGIRHARSAAAS